MTENNKLRPRKELEEVKRNYVLTRLYRELYICID